MGFSSELDRTQRRRGGRKEKKHSLRGERQFARKKRYFLKVNHPVLFGNGGGEGE